MSRRTRLAASVPAFTLQPALAGATRAGHTPDVQKYVTGRDGLRAGRQTLAPSHDSRRRWIIRAQVRDCPTLHAPSAQVSEPALSSRLRQTTSAWDLVRCTRARTP